MTDPSMPAPSRGTHPPVYGPTEILGDDQADNLAVVQIALPLTREQLRAALAIGHAQMAGQPPLPDMTASDVRREVEGYLAAGAVFELYRETDAVNERLSADHTAALDTAVDRAYTGPETTAPRKQSPRYRDRTVILQTDDHGEVTIPEPTWCIGHDDDLVGYLADITHNGPVITADVLTARYGRTPILEARITQAPHGEIRPEPQPLLTLQVDIDATVAPEDGRHITRALRAAAARLDRALDELTHLRGERR